MANLPGSRFDVEISTRPRSSAVEDGGIHQLDHWRDIIVSGPKAVDVTAV